jgi:LCP family protein required for cell wall assembly
MKRRPLSRDIAPPERPYMPTPDEYVTSLDTNQQEEFLDRPKPRHRRSHWKRWVLVGGIVIVAAVLVYVGYIASILAKVSTQPLDLSGLSADSSGRTNVLVLGEGDPDHAGANLTDTMMVVSYDRSSKRIAQISIPRDLRVRIPDHGTGKINSANALGGTQLAAQTVSDTLGIPINYVVQTNFSGLKGLVNAVGGIDVNVKQPLVDPEYPCEDNQYKSCGLDIEPGPQHMDGTVALQYVRCRKGTCGNDFGRAARQQEVIGLVRAKLAKWQTVANPSELIAVTTAVRDSLSTDLGAVQMIEFAWDWQSAQQRNPIQLVFSTSPGGYLINASGSSDLLPADGTYEAMSSRVQNIFTTPTAAGDVPK